MSDRDQLHLAIARRVRRQVQQGIREAEVPRQRQAKIYTYVIDSLLAAVDPKAKMPPLPGSDIPTARALAAQAKQDILYQIGEVLETEPTDEKGVVNEASTRLYKAVVIELHALEVKQRTLMLAAALGTAGVAGGIIAFYRHRQHQKKVKESEGDKEEKPPENKPEK